MEKYFILLPSRLLKIWAALAFLGVGLASGLIVLALIKSPAVQAAAPANPSGTIIPGDYTVTGVETWTLAGSPYIVQGALIISSTGNLTIQPGVTVQIGDQIAIRGGGKLSAHGTTAQLIVFTSVDPGGHFYRIDFNSGSIASLDYCDISRGGKDVNEGIIVRSSSVTIDNSIIHDFISSVDVLFIDGAGLAPAIQNTEIHHNTGWPILQSSVDMNPVYHHLNLHDNANNGVRVGGQYLNRNVTLDGSPATLNGVAFYLDAVTVRSGFTLTVTPGTTLRFSDGNSLAVDGGGALSAVGLPGQHITLTSYDSSSYFNNLYFSQGSTVNLDYCDISRGGHNVNEGFVIRSSSVTIDHSTIQGFIAGSTVFYLDGAGLSPTIQNTEIHHNTGWSILQTSVDMTPVYHNLNLHDNSNNGVRVGGQYLNRNVTLDGSPATLNGASFFLDWVTVRNGFTLTVTPGTTLRFSDGSGLVVEGGGTLSGVGTPGQHITLTSYDNSSYFNNFSFSQDSIIHLDYCDFSRGGHNVNEGFVIRSSSVTIDHSTIQGFIAGSTVFYLDGAGLSPTIQNTEIHHNTGWSILQTSVDMNPVYHNLKLHNNGSDGVTVGGGYLNRDVTLDGSPAVLNGASYYVYAINVTPGHKLTITPATTLHFYEGQGIEIQGGGSLLAEGTAIAPIFFTSRAATPQPGDWTNITPDAGAVMHLDHCDIGYAGEPFAIHLAENSDLQIKNSRIHHTKGHGLWLTGDNLTALLENIEIDHNRDFAIMQTTLDMAPLYSNINIHDNGADAVGITLGWMAPGELNHELVLDLKAGLNGKPMVFLGGNYNSVTVGSAGKLVLKPGTVIKIAHGEQFLVKGILDVQGTITQPVVFTSLNDDEYGGDTLNDGNKLSPAPGDWYRIHVVGGGDAAFDHTLFRYGAGDDPTGAAMVFSDEDAKNVTIQNSILSNGFYSGIIAWNSTVNISSSLVLGFDRGVNASWGGNVNITNCTFDSNRIGLNLHGGVLNVVNTLITNSLEVGIEHDLGDDNLTIRYSDVVGSGSKNYDGTADRTGTNHNLSVNPRYKNVSSGNYRLTYKSPVIDAADGSVAPLTDIVNAPRFDDPPTPNTGIPTAGGAYADMGAYEFVENAGSNIDLVVTEVTGPQTATAGETIVVTWKVKNQGATPATGPWYDAVSLVLNPGANPTVLPAAEFLVGQGEVLNKGQELLVVKNVRVPGGVEGNYYWQVVTNAHGDIFEGSLMNNNTIHSLDAVTLSVPELALGGAPLSRTFTAEGEPFWFKFSAHAGQDVTVSLNRGNGVSELYIGQGYMPTRETFDARYMEWNAATVSAVTHLDADKTCYILAYPQSLAPAPDIFTIATQVLDFGIKSFNPQRIGNLGLVTLEFRGGQLAADMNYEIVDPTGNVYAASEVTLINSTQAFATFKMQGYAAGVYDVRVRKTGGGTALLPASLVVEEHSSAQVIGMVSGLHKIRVLTHYPYEFTFGNAGNVDAYGTPVLSGFFVSGNWEVLSPAPPLINGTPVDWHDLVSPFAYNNSAALQFPPVRIRPGEFYTITIQFYLPGLMDFDLKAIWVGW